MNNKITKILKLLEKNLYKVDAHTFLSDVFECGAISISNRFDFRNYDKREKSKINATDYDVIKICNMNFVGDNIRKHIIVNTDAWTAVREETKKELFEIF